MVACDGPTARILNGPVQLREKSVLEDLVVGIFACPLTNCGHGVVHPYPVADGILRAAVEGVGEGSLMVFGPRACWVRTRS